MRTCSIARERLDNDVRHYVVDVQDAVDVIGTDNAKARLLSTAEGVNKHVSRLVDALDRTRDDLG